MILVRQPMLIHEDQIVSTIEDVETDHVIALRTHADVSHIIRWVFYALGQVAHSMGPNGHLKLDDGRNIWFCTYTETMNTMRLLSRGSVEFVVEKELADAMGTVKASAWLEERAS